MVSSLTFKKNWVNFYLYMLCTTIYPIVYRQKYLILYKSLVICPSHQHQGIVVFQFLKINKYLDNFTKYFLVRADFYFTTLLYTNWKAISRWFDECLFANISEICLVSDQHKILLHYWHNFPAAFCTVHTK